MAHTVLVVEDHAPSRQLLARLLARQGYAVRSAPDGLAALGEIGRARPDLVLSDIHMPGLDGIGLIRRLREDGIAVPVVLVSDDGAGVPAGVPFLPKPIDFLALRALLAQLLG
ncbi:MAG: two-component system, OmpR family, response regulator MprA [Thermomicrobiales bacterium]|jgi:CheY-like chemotaxis protein|nr:two-component system, OmpR family, response regulator MprA [Thermomicrobiales bacterium]